MDTGITLVESTAAVFNTYAGDVSSSNAAVNAAYEQAAAIVEQFWQGGTTDIVAITGAIRAKKTTQHREGMQA